MLFGTALQVEPHIVRGFAVLAVFPLMFRFFKKRACLRCGLQFQSDSGEEAEEDHIIP